MKGEKEGGKVSGKRCRANPPSMGKKRGCEPFHCVDFFTGFSYIETRGENKSEDELTGK